VISELNLRSQLLTGFEIAAFDLRAQILSDLPVHGVCHLPPSLGPRPSLKHLCNLVERNSDCPANHTHLNASNAQRRYQGSGMTE
jgi:hypothetical protein